MNKNCSFVERRELFPLLGRNWPTVPQGPKYLQQTISRKKWVLKRSLLSQIVQETK